MRSSGDYSGVGNIEATIRPSERFTHLANVLLPKEKTNIGVCYKSEREVEWFSNDGENHYKLLELTSADDSAQLWLEVYEQDKSVPSECYSMGPGTNGEIRELNNNGDIIDNPFTNQSAAIEVLTILSEAVPDHADKELEFHITQDFWQLAGTFIISDRTVEQRLDRTTSMIFDTNRMRFTKFAIDSALEQFQSSVRTIVEEASKSDGLSTLAGDIAKVDYVHVYGALATEATDSFFTSNARLNDLRPSVKLRRNIVKKLYRDTDNESSSN